MKLTILVVALAILSMVPQTTSAQVIVSFTNTIGGISGTVTIEVEGLTDGTTSAASSVILLSYPSGALFGSPGTTLTNWTYQDVNQFTLNASGVLISEDFDVADCPAGFCGTNNVDVFTLDSISPPLSPQPSTPSPIDFLGYGTYEGSLGTGPYPTAVVTVPTVSTTPEPSSLLLFGTGFVGLMGRIGLLRRKRCA